MCPYKDKSSRDVAHEVLLEKKRPQAHTARMIRQRARRAYDKAGIDREGLDIDHVKGTGAGNGKGNLRLRKPEDNRSFSRNADSTMKENKPKGKRK